MWGPGEKTKTKRTTDPRLFTFSPWVPSESSGSPELAVAARLYENLVADGLQAGRSGSLEIWLWVRNGYPKWNPGNQGLKPVVLWWLNFDSYPYGCGSKLKQEVHVSAYQSSILAPVFEPQPYVDPILWMDEIHFAPPNRKPGMMIFL